MRQHGALIITNKLELCEANDVSRHGVGSDALGGVVRKPLWAYIRQGLHPG
jgi:hypothetical protein